jgi:hypothetical protein
MVIGLQCYERLHLRNESEKEATGLLLVYSCSVKACQHILQLYITVKCADSYITVECADRRHIRVQASDASE